MPGKVRISNLTLKNVLNSVTYLAIIVKRVLAINEWTCLYDVLLRFL